MKKLLIVLLAFFIVACSKQNTKNQNSSSIYKGDIQRIEKHFPTGMLEHFPNKLNGSYMFEVDYPSTIKHNNRCGVILVNYYNDKFFQIDTLLDNIEYKVKPDEKCLLVVDMFDDKATGEVYLDNLKKYCTEFLPPIPNFYKILRDEEQIEFLESGSGRLSDKYTLFIYESKKGKFLPDKNLPFGYGLPNQWKNGISKGIALNKKDKIAIFWLEIW